MTSLARLLAIPLLLLPVVTQAASFTPLGDLAGGPFSSSADDISDNGAVVVGSSVVGLTGATLPAYSYTRPFRWSDGVMTGLGLVYPSTGGAGAVSADGSVVVGVLGRLTGPVIEIDETYREAFRWSGGTMSSIGYLPGHSFSSASGVSADGEVVVGASSPYNFPGDEQAFRWEDGAMIGLDRLPGSFWSWATDVSADGQVIVGMSAAAATGQPVAVRWDDGAISSLSGFSDEVYRSDALAVSADGAFVVGSMYGEEFQQAFRWTGSEVLGLGFLADRDYDYSTANDVSADGSVVVGQSSTGLNSWAAFLWTEANGMQRLSDVLAANGATGLEGWTLLDANGVSADGRWIVGAGINPDGFQEAFLADISPVPAPATFWLLGSALAALVCVRR